MEKLTRPQGTKRKFTKIKDGNFMILPQIGKTGELPEVQTYSPDLYIKDGYHLHVGSPLYKLIQMQLIVENRHNTKFHISGYTAYRFVRPLVDLVTTAENPDKTQINENDCLKFAEAMGLAMKYGDIDYVETHLRKDISRPELCVRTNPTTKFGEGIMKNRKLYETIPPDQLDNNAIPNPGEAYAIVRKESKKKKDVDEYKADYHIAFVIYSENGINITLEAEANNGLHYLPKFSFYDTDPLGYTFHKRWSGNLPDDSVERRDELYSNGHTYALIPRHLIPQSAHKSVSKPAKSASKSIAKISKKPAKSASKPIAKSASKKPAKIMHSKTQKKNAVK